MGPEPYGLALLPNGNVAVTLHTRAQLAVVDLAAAAVVQRIDLPFIRPTSIAVLEDGTAYVAHLVSSSISHVDVQHGGVLDVISRDATTDPSVGNASLLANLTLHPNGRQLAVANVSVTPNPPPGVEATPTGYLGRGPKPVVAMVSTVDLDAPTPVVKRNVLVSNAAEPTAMAYLDDGRTLAVVSRGGKSVGFYGFDGTADSSATAPHRWELAQMAWQ